MKDILEAVTFCVLMALLTWLYLLSTPDQLSGEADAHNEMVIQKEGSAE